MRQCQGGIYTRAQFRLLTGETVQPQEEPMSAGAVLCSADLLNEGFQVASSARSIAGSPPCRGLSRFFS